MAGGSIAAVDSAADIPSGHTVGDIAGDIAAGTVDVIGPAAARRAALAAQGFADARPPARSRAGTSRGCSPGSGCCSSTR